MAATAGATTTRQPIDTKVRQWLQIGVLVAPLVLLAWLTWRHRWTFDDGFINFRTVRQLEAGNGPVFNAGERVESYTSALWIAYLYLGDVLTPIRIEWIAVLGGIVGTVTGVGLATVASVRLARRNDPDAILVPLGSLAIVAVAPMWYFATAGLEGGLTFGWIGATYFVAVRWGLGPGPAPRHAAIVIGLGWLIRPDLALLTLPVLAVLVVGDRGFGRGAMLRTVALAAALPLAYQVFRMGYFAQLLPNTAIAKEAGAAHWGRGWDYLRSFAEDFHLWIFAVVAVALSALLVRRLWAADRHRSSAVVTAFVGGAVLQVAYVTRVGGDYIPARLLLPALFTLAAPVAAVPLVRWWSTALVATGVAWAGFAFVADRPGGIVYGSAFGIDQEGVVTLDAALNSRYGVLVDRYRHPGIYFGGVRLDARPGPAATPHTVDDSGIGIIGFGLGTDVRVLDWLGLVDPLTAHFAIRGDGLAGHEKPIPGPWAAARLTAPGSKVSATVFEPPALFAPLIPHSSGAAFDREVATVRSTLRCRRIRAFVASYRAPLTADRFASNFFDSFSNNSFRIPPEPARARRALCGK